MKKASSSFLLLVFAALLMSFQSYAQISVEIGRGQGQGNHGNGNGNGNGPRGPRPGQGQGQQPDYNDYSQPLPQQQSQMLHEEIRQNIRSYERLSLSQLLRLSYGQENSMELVTLSLRAQSMMNGPAQLDLMQNGRIISSQTVRRQANEIVFMIPMRTLLGGIELSAVSEIYLESITAQVQSSYNPYPGPGPGRDQQVSPNSLITLSVNQRVNGFGNIDLDMLARQQMGVTLNGAQIDRVVVQGQPSMYGRAASVQVELNRRPVGEMKYLSPAQRQLPLQVQSLEEVRSLALIVNGDADIQEIRIRVGNVRPQGPIGPQGPATQRIYVQQEVSSRYPLALSGLLPYENRMIRSVTIEARARVGGQSQLILSAIYGGQQGAIMINQAGSARATIRLARPMSASELQLITNSVVQVEALEIEFDQYYR